MYGVETHYRRREPLGLGDVIELTCRGRLECKEDPSLLLTPVVERTRAGAHLQSSTILDLIPIIPLTAQCRLGLHGDFTSGRGRNGCAPDQTGPGDNDRWSDWRHYQATSLASGGSVGPSSQGAFMLTAAPGGVYFVSFLV